MGKRRKRGRERKVKKGKREKEKRNREEKREGEEGVILFKKFVDEKKRGWESRRAHNSPLLGLQFHHDLSK